MTAYKDVPEAIIIDPKREELLAGALLEHAAQAIGTYVFMAWPPGEANALERMRDIEEVLAACRRDLEAAVRVHVHAAKEPQA